jgi:hypothetical protein
MSNNNLYQVDKAIIQESKRIFKDINLSAHKERDFMFCKENSKIYINTQFDKSTHKIFSFHLGKENKFEIFWIKIYFKNQKLQTNLSDEQIFEINNDLFVYTINFIPLKQILNITSIKEFSQNLYKKYFNSVKSESQNSIVEELAGHLSDRGKNKEFICKIKEKYKNEIDDELFEKLNQELIEYLCEPKSFEDFIEDQNRGIKMRFQIMIYC